MALDMLYLDDPRNGVSELHGFIDGVPFWEKALLD